MESGTYRQMKSSAACTAALGGIQGGGYTTCPPPVVAVRPTCSHNDPRFPSLLLAKPGMIQLLYGGRVPLRMFIMVHDDGYYVHTFTKSPPGSKVQSPLIFVRAL